MNTYQLPGLKVSITGTPGKLQDALEWLFQLCPQTGEHPELWIRATGVQGSVMTKVPAWLCSRLSTRKLGETVMMLRGPMGERATVGWFDGLLFCAWTDSREDVIELVCGMREDRNTRSIIPSVLVPMLREVLSRRRRLLLHAAAVYCPNAVGIQLVAPSCGGKTTTSMSLVRRGALLVADDLLVLDSSCEHPKVFGIPKLLNLRRPTMEIFQELCQYSEVEHRLRGKASVHPQALFGPGCTTASCPVHVIYFLNLTAGPPSAYPLETEEALKRLILCHTFAYEQEIAAASVIMLCELLSCARTYQLNTGENADGLGGWLLDNCAEHATPHFVGSPEDKTGDE